MKDWDYEASDYIRLMTDFLGGCISVEQYRSKFFNMNAKRHMLSDEQDVVIQKAYGDADDYDDAVSLPYTIDLPTLRGRVANSVSSTGVGTRRHNYTRGLVFPWTSAANKISDSC